MTPTPTALPAHQAWVMLRKALTFATLHHQAQLRKDGQTPVLHHLVRVAMLVAHHSDASATIIAALLHDVIEDTGASYDDVRDQFGSEVADLVVALTEDRRQPRAQRKHASEAALAQAPPAAQMIKLADIFDNLCDLDVSKAESSRREKQLDHSERLVAILAEASPELARACREQIAHLRKSGVKVSTC